MLKLISVVVISLLAATAAQAQTFLAPVALRSAPPPAAAPTPLRA